MPGPLIARSRRHDQAGISCAAIAGVAGSLLVAPDVRGALGAGLSLVMLAIAVIDMRHLIIPDELNAAGFALALVNAAIQSPETILAAVAAAVLRGAVAALFFLGIRVAYRRLRQREGIGLGDVKLAGVAGAWLDWLTIPIAVEIAAVAALAAYVMRGRSVDPMTRLPFGLFLAPGIWLGWLIDTMALNPP